MDILANSVTLKEVLNQPTLWVSVYQKVLKQKKELESFLTLLRQQKNLEVIFTGAGSSAFVGEIVSGVFQKHTSLRSRAVATTDIVTHPELHLDKTKPTLLVSFARSGNSPESLATVNLVNEVHPDVFHLIITCNAQGALAQIKTSDRVKIILLPEEANDKGLAMVGSVTGMILATLLFAKASQMESLSLMVEQTCQAGLRAMDFQKDLQKMAEKKFERIVCLGSGPALGVAREAHLKVQELSDGQIIGKWDSYLGFRHGPKAVLNEKTLVLCFLSSDPYVLSYEKDLIDSIRREQKPMAIVCISNSKTHWTCDLSIALNPERTISDDFLMMPYLLPAQLLAIYKSAHLGLNPDAPSARGAIHRVVQGVTIYNYTRAT